MTELKSTLVSLLSGLTLIDRIVRLIKTAGAKSEADTDRDGFLSYHAETHAVGAGVGVGYLAVASGSWKVLGAMLTLAVYGNRGGKVFEPRLLNDVKSERHYFLGGLVVGGVFGALSRLAVGAGLPALPSA